MVRKRGTATRSDVDDGETEEPHKLEEKEMRVFAENCNEDDEWFATQLTICNPFNYL